MKSEIDENNAVPPFPKRFIDFMSLQATLVCISVSVTGKNKCVREVRESFDQKMIKFMPFLSFCIIKNPV